MKTPATVPSDNRLVFKVKGGGVKITYDKQIPFTTFLQIIFTGILGVMLSMVRTAPETIKEQVKGDLYDLLNISASRTLELFAPEYEARAHLTTEAILKAENELIEEAIKNGKEIPLS